MHGTAVALIPQDGSRPDSKYANLSTLPVDTLLDIILYLNLEDIPNLLLCTKHLYSLSYERVLWIMALAHTRQFRPLSLPSRQRMDELPIPALLSTAAQAIRAYNTFAAATHGVPSHLYPQRPATFISCPVVQTPLFPDYRCRPRIVTVIPGTSMVLIYASIRRLELWCLDRREVLLRESIAGGPALSMVRICDVDGGCLVALLCNSDVDAGGGHIYVYRVSYRLSFKQGCPEVSDIAMVCQHYTQVTSPLPLTRLVSTICLSPTLLGIVWSRRAVVTLIGRTAIEFMDFRSGEVRSATMNCDLSGSACQASFTPDGSLNIIVDSDRSNGKLAAHTIPAHLFPRVFPPILSPSNSHDSEEITRPVKKIITAYPSTHALPADPKGWERHHLHDIFGGVPAVNSGGAVVRGLCNPYATDRSREGVVHVQFLSLLPHPSVGASTSITGCTLSTRHAIHMAATAHACLVILPGEPDPLRLVYHDVARARAVVHILVLPEELRWDAIVSIAFDECWGRLLMVDACGGMWIIAYS